MQPYLIGYGCFSFSSIALPRFFKGWFSPNKRNCESVYANSLLAVSIP